MRLVPLAAGLVDMDAHSAAPGELFSKARPRGM